MILLLARNALQERTLQIILKLGGHHTHAVRNEHEAINMIKSIPDRVRGVVLGTADSPSQLPRCIETFQAHRINTPIYLVALLGHEETISAAVDDSHNDLNLAVYNNQQLLRRLSEP